MRTVRSAFLALAAKLRFSIPRPNEPKNYGETGKNEHQPGEHSFEPAEDVLHTEWSAFQTFVGEIQKSDNEHQAAEHRLGIAQLRTAQCLNKITIIGALVSLLGLLAVALSLTIAKNAADDGHIAALAASSSADIARVSLVAGQRAYVAAEATGVPGLDQNDGATPRLEISIIWVNAGNTPTRHFINHVSVFRTDENLLTNHWDYPDVWLGNPPAAQRFPLGQINPKQPLRSAIIAIPMSIAELVAQRRTNLYVWGWAKYNDVFAGTDQHITRTAAQVYIFGDPTRKNELQVKFNEMPKYNCADEECAKDFPVDWVPRDLVLPDSTITFTTRVPEAPRNSVEPSPDKK